MTTLYAFVGSEIRIVDNATFDTKNVEVVAKWVHHACGEDDETHEDGYIVRNANGVLYAYVKHQSKGDDDVVTIHHLTEKEAIRLCSQTCAEILVPGQLELGSIDRLA
jgi:hypothetical protein